MANRIHAKGPYTHEEYKAASALIYPGYLLKVDANGEVIPHNIAGGLGEALFAEEDALQGNTVDTIYADNSIVSCILPCKGSCIRAMIKDGENISIGELLKSNGDGTLVSAGEVVGSAITMGGAEYVIAVACEAVDLTVSATEDSLIEVRIV